jgi:Rrf2 family transcriptional regulator, cysteine metabolism repressor
MVISQRCKYALKALIELARRNASTPVRVQEIANSQGVPVKFLESILNELKHGGFVGSKRGSEGGYYLIKTPDEIKLGHVIRLIQGPTEDIVKDKTDTDYFGVSAMKRFWEKVVIAIDKTYDSTSIADLIAWELASQCDSNYMI